MEEIKQELFRRCTAFILERINTAETALQQAQEASNDDTKSSAGDKFETTREMMQQDIARNKNLLFDGQQNLQVLNSIENAPATEQARNGSLVWTNNGAFYISISAGQITIGENLVFAISAVSPIGKLLIGKGKGEIFSFNGKTYSINKVE